MIRTALYILYVYYNRYDDYYSPLLSWDELNFLPYFRRDGHLRSADDVVITDIESAGTNAVQFSVYVQSNDGVLSGNELLNAVQV